MESNLFVYLNKKYSNFTHAVFVFILLLYNIGVSYNILLHEKLSLKFIKFIVILLKYLLINMDKTFIKQFRQQKSALFDRCRELP